MDIPINLIPLKNSIAGFNGAHGYKFKSPEEFMKAYQTYLDNKVLATAFSPKYKQIRKELNNNYNDAMLFMAYLLRKKIFKSSVN